MTLGGSKKKIEKLGEEIYLLDFLLRIKIGILNPSSILINNPLDIDTLVF